MVCARLSLQLKLFKPGFSERLLGTLKVEDLGSQQCPSPRTRPLPSALSGPSQPLSQALCQVPLQLRDWLVNTQFWLAEIPVAPAVGCCQMGRLCLLFRNVLHRLSTVQPFAGEWQGGHVRVKEKYLVWTLCQTSTPFTLYALHNTVTVRIDWFICYIPTLSVCSL